MTVMLAKEPNSQPSQEGRGHLELPKQAKLAPLASGSAVHRPEAAEGRLVDGNMRCAAVTQRRAAESLCSLLHVLAGFNLSEGTEASELQAAACLMSHPDS